MSADVRRTIEDALDWTVRSLAEEVHEVQGGWVARSRSLARVHSVNLLQVHGPLEPDLVLAIADENLDDLPYRHIEVDDARTALRLEERILSSGSGWKRDREVVMVLGSPSATMRGGDARPDLVARLGDEERDELMRQWLVEDGFDVAPDVLDQWREHNHREGELWRESTLGVREADQPVALTKSRALDGVGWVEDVYTVPGARRRGHARFLVGHAISLARAAGHDPTFIVADDNDWPKHLYSDLGFEPVGCQWSFHRDLDV